MTSRKRSNLGHVKLGEVMESHEISEAQKSTNPGRGGGGVARPRCCHPTDRVVFFGGLESSERLT